MVYIGFKSSLNYPFVVQHSLLSAQIFEYLPQVLTFPFAGSSNYDETSVKRLIPFTAAGIDYTITVAEVYFPSDLALVLSLFIVDTGSSLYRNTDATQSNLAALIDPRVPLTGLNADDSSSLGGSAKALNNNGSIDDQLTAPVTHKGRIAGVTIGAAAACGLYMSLMVLLFKRFKQKKAVELPSSDSESNVGLHSLHSNIQLVFQRFSSSSHVSPDLTSAEGLPVSHPRSVQISDPVNTSNSLGWTH